MKQLKKLSLIVIPALIAGCSTHLIQNRGTDYLKAKSIPPLVIPQGLSSSSIHADYPVSDRNYPNSDKLPDLIPPDL